MGAWSGEPFGNDTASDWLWELDDSSDWDVVRGALELALDTDDELDADVATNAIAAAAVVARGIGHSATRSSVAAGAEDDEPEPDLDENGDDNEGVDEAAGTINAFLGRAGEPSSDLVQLAISALDAATGPSSELTELWNESGADEWEKANEAIRAELGG